MKPAYVLLSGAKCNLGDFLITERATALLKALRPDRELRLAPAWESLDPSSDLLRDVRAIVIAGGPGYQPAMVPAVYPLAERLDDLPCPVVPLGLGWKGPAGDAFAVDGYRFTPQTRAALRWMEARTAALGCRDELTEQVLRRNGVRRVAMVGCPVWYDLDRIGSEMQLPREIGRVVFTPPQARVLAEQGLAAARCIAAAFPSAEKIASFHRGLGAAGRWVSAEDVEHNERIASELDALGFDVVNVTGDTSKIAFYDECNLHVGYRLHAHLWFLSRRKPSLLIEEDGRGAGASQALRLPGVPAFRGVPSAQRLRRWLPGGILHRMPGLSEPYRVDEGAPEALARLLREELETGFKRFAGVGRRLDHGFVRMRDFVRALP